MKIFPHMWFNLVANSELKYLQTKPLEHKMNLYVRIMSSGRNISSEEWIPSYCFLKSQLPHEITPSL